MRGLVAAAALCAAAVPAQARPAAIDPDSLTVSGRFELPQAPASLAGRVRLGAVRLDPTVAERTGQDPVALAAALRQAMGGSLGNFGYLAADGADDAVRVDVDLAPLAVQRTDQAARVAARLTVSGPASGNACLSRTGEGRFTALERRRSGGGQRAAAVGIGLAFAFVGSYGGEYIGDQFVGAAQANAASNTLRAVGTGEGVAPRFGENELMAFAAAGAVRLALADYLRQLGGSRPCAAPGGAEKPRS